MNVMPGLRLRTSVVLLQIGTIVVTLAVVGTMLLAYLAQDSARENERYAERASQTMAHRVESFLQDLTQHVRLIGKYYQTSPAANPKPFVTTAPGSHFDAVFLVGADARLKAASLLNRNAARERELIGIDLSAYPLLQAAIASKTPTWSDKHISAITGNVTVGLAVPLEGGEAVIAEVPLRSILEVGNIFREKGKLDYWIVDSKGEVVADTGSGQTQLMNVSRMEIVQTGFSGADQPKRMTFRNQKFHVAATYSQKLGWLFVGRVPAGFANPDLRGSLYIVLAFSLGAAVFAFLLTPLWVRQISRSVGAVTQLASDIAKGNKPKHWPRSSIRELNNLSVDLKAMSEAIAKREEELRILNEGLEARVEQRTIELTRINKDLKKALAEVQLARDELIQSEKVAALGRMVAGISHELNTPLGNGRMVVSTLASRLEGFRDRLTDPVDSNDLMKFLETVELSVEIAESNLVRAGNLVRSFKEISADRTASRRRKVVLKELFDEVSMTLTPMLKRSPVTLQVDVPGTIWIDSYPGELGQVITNLVENATIHAFRNKDAGTIAITAETTGDDKVTIHVSDDGCGMAPDVARRAFDPFFTTALGKGGTGLGLFIVHRTVQAVLGGSVTLTSKLGMGTAFKIQIPIAAPVASDQDIESGLKVG